MKRIFAIAIISLLSGCATAPDNAPSFENAAVGEPDENGAILVLYRKKVPPLIYKIKATLDDQPFANLPNNSFSWIYLTPGEYKIKMAWPLVAMASGSLSHIEVKANEYYFIEFDGSVELSTMSNVYNRSSITAQEYEFGLNQVKECCQYIPSTYK